VGFDDLPFAQFLDPPLTTIRLPVVELARQASQMLMSLMDGDLPACQQTILETNLIVRKSCGIDLHS
jgi:DNA-binding LacI/PurR family transcriptional regulator